MTFKLPNLGLVMLVGLLGGMPSQGQAMTEAIALDEGLTYSVDLAGGAIDSDVWWASFEDSQLTELITTGLSSNYDLDAARENLKLAEAVVWQARSPLFPMVSAVGSVSMQPQEAFFSQMGGGVPPNPCDGNLPLTDETGAPVVDPTGNVVYVPEPDEGCLPFFYRGSAMLQASYQLDIWGRAFTAARAATFSAKATSHDRDVFAQGIGAQIGEAYYDVVSAKQQLEALEHQLTINQKLLELTELRYESGQVQGPDVLQQRQQTAAAKSRIPNARIFLESSYRRLAALTGQNPATFRPDTGNLLPNLPKAVGTGMPNDLLWSRPDLRSSQDRIQSAQANLRSARRSSLPTLNITGQAGWTVQDFGLGAGSDTYDVLNLSANLSIPLFRGGLAVSGVQQVSAAEKATVKRFNQDVLGAIAEVESLLVKESQLTLQLDATETQLEAAKLAFEELQNRYEDGVGSYVALLASLNSYQAAELGTISVQRSLISNRIQLHLALGGDWTRGLGANQGEE